MSVFTSADYESAITTEYIEELAEEFGLDEIASTISTKRELNSETQEFTAISGSSGGVVIDRFFVCVDFWETLENDTYAYDYDRSYRARSYRKGEFAENRTCIARVFEDLDYDAMFAMECARECEFYENFGLISKYDEEEPEFSLKEISEISKGQVFQCEIPLMENILRF